jgi:hypothetical protein
MPTTSRKERKIRLSARWETPESGGSAPNDEWHLRAHSTLQARVLRWLTGRSDPNTAINMRSIAYPKLLIVIPLYVIIHLSTDPAAYDQPRSAVSSAGFRLWVLHEDSYKIISSFLRKLELLLHPI